MPGRKDENRIIIAVTGANSGVGLGYCHRILRQLSTPPPSPPADALQIPLASTSSVSTHDLTSPHLNSFTSSPPPTLTLILACRSRSKAELAIKSLRKEHELGLIGRKMRGHKEREGWLEGLEIVFEELDVDKVGGRGGCLDFSRRIRENYPHLTTLVLNAGIAATTGINWAGAFRQLSVDPIGGLSHPNYLIEERGRTSADGMRGGVWGVNVLSGYILAKELRSHLQKSPPSLPLSPRILYVSSSTANPAFLPSPPSQDLQLLKGNSYGASKYIGDIVTSRLDWEFNSVEDKDKKGEEEGESKRQVRVMRLDPGVVWTSVSSSYTPMIMQWLMAAMFYLARWLGSRIHVISSDVSAFGLTWLTLVPALFLEPPQPPSTPTSRTPNPSTSPSSSESLLYTSSTSPAPSKYLSECWRSGRPYVKLSSVSQWEKYGTGSDGGDAFVAECERVYREWKERERVGRDDPPKVDEALKTD